MLSKDQKSPLKEDEVRVVLTSLKKARRNDFDRFCDLMDANEVVQAF